MPHNLEKSPTWFLHLISNVKTKWEIFFNFVAFSEYINFKQGVPTKLDDCIRILIW
jgi:hypothetical protein